MVLRAFSWWIYWMELKVHSGSRVYFSYNLHFLHARRRQYGLTFVFFFFWRGAAAVQPYLRCRRCLLWVTGTSELTAISGSSHFATSQAIVTAELHTRRMETTRPQEAWCCSPKINCWAPSPGVLNLAWVGINGIRHSRVSCGWMTCG